MGEWEIVWHAHTLDKVESLVESLAMPMWTPQADHIQSLTITYCTGKSSDILPTGVVRSSRTGTGSGSSFPVRQIGAPEASDATSRSGVLAKVVSIVDHRDVTLDSAT